MNSIGSDPLVGVYQISKHFSDASSAFGRDENATKAVDDVTLGIDEGASLGLVGESGSGKTTLGYLILRLLRPTSGSVRFEGDDLAKLTRKELQHLRREMQIVFQDPDSCFNPRRTIEQSLVEPLIVHKTCSRPEALERALALVGKVGLDPSQLARHPHELSGGQRQRAAIARALMTNPKFVVFDEPTSSLDVSVQAKILRLIDAIRDELQITYLFISHDLSVVRQICASIAVMYMGKIVEVADTEQIFSSPLHPYTQALMEAVPSPDPRERVGPAPQSDRQDKLENGEIPKGCRFHARCPYVMDVCKTNDPPLKQPDEYSESRDVACYLHFEPSSNL